MENSPMTPGILHFSRSLSIASGQTIFSKHLSSYSTHPYRKNAIYTTKTDIRPK